jgi:hypothetical protein
MCLFFKKCCNKPLSKLLDAPLDARFGAEKFVLSSTDENRFKFEIMGRHPSPHISRLTENIYALSRQPDITTSTVIHLWPFVGY